MVEEWEVPMLVLRNDTVILRDFVESDIADHIRWETVETEWKLWDAPWEHEGKTDEERAAELEEDIERMHGWVERNKVLADDVRRTKFEVCLADSDDPLRATHVGSCATYQIDDDFNIVEGGPHCALGIDINNLAARGRGCATAALQLLIDYLFELGEPAVYCQTWSGNVRMIGLAEKLGFHECCRKPDIRLVRGVRCDGLTFVLNRGEWR